MSRRRTSRYNLHMDSSASARFTVQRWRDEIARAVRLASSGPLAVVLADAGCGHCYVVKALDVHPCLGKVKGRRLLATLGIAQSSRMEELPGPHRTAIAEVCGCDNG